MVNIDCMTMKKTPNMVNIRLYDNGEITKYGEHRLIVIQSMFTIFGYFPIFIQSMFIIFGYFPIVIQSYVHHI
jgi:hypothetical protein